MRLTDAEVAAIKASALEVFGPDAVVRLFGSRLDDNRRGGDIDLHVQLASSASVDAGAAQFRRLLERRVGERDYDILIAVAGRSPSPIDRKALTEGKIL